MANVNSHSNYSPAGAQPNFSLIDGMACLQAVAGSEVSCSVKDLAGQLGRSATRVNRLLKTLQYLGFVEQDRSRKYRPGPALPVLAAQSLFGSRLLSVALPFLENLAHHGHVVALGVLWRDQVAYLYHQPPGVTTAEAIGRAGLFPAQESAIGLALMAERPAGQSADDLDPDDYLEIRDILAMTRHQGYAHVRPAMGQHRLGVVIGQPHPVAALAVAGAIPPEEIPEIVAHLQQSAESISTLLAQKSFMQPIQPQIQKIQNERAA